MFLLYKIVLLNWFGLACVRKFSIASACRGVTTSRASSHRKIDSKPRGLPQISKMWNDRSMLFSHRRFGFKDLFLWEKFGETNVTPKPRFHKHVLRGPSCIFFFETCHHLLPAFFPLHQIRSTEKTTHFTFARHLFTFPPIVNGWLDTRCCFHSLDLCNN